MSYENILVVQR